MGAEEHAGTIAGEECEPGGGICSGFDGVPVVGKGRKSGPGDFLGALVGYFAAFHWPNRRAPRWRFWIEWSLVALSMLIVIGVVAALAVAAFR